MLKKKLPKLVFNLYIGVFLVGISLFSYFAYTTGSLEYQLAIQKHMSYEQVFSFVILLMALFGFMHLSSPIAIVLKKYSKRIREWDIKTIEKNYQEWRKENNLV